MSDILFEIDSAADWRINKSIEDPENAHRHDEASTILQGLSEYVRSLPSDHELFTLEDHLVEVSEELDDSDTAFELIDRRGSDLSFYGIQYKCTPEEWVTEEIFIMNEMLERLEADN